MKAREAKVDEGTRWKGERSNIITLGELEKKERERNAGRRVFMREATRKTD